MSIELLKRVEQETKVDDDADLGHIVCHCDLHHGWCGISIGFVIETADGEHNCPDCEAKLLEFDGKCPWGCDCTPDERMLYCGVDPEDEDE